MHEALIPPPAIPSTDISFRTRKWIRPEDLNANGTLFGGSLLNGSTKKPRSMPFSSSETAGQLRNTFSEINFVSSAEQGDLVEMGLTATRFGRTSLTMRAEVRNMITRQSILTIEEIVFVNLNSKGRPEPHGYDRITYDRGRVPTDKVRHPPREQQIRSDEGEQDDLRQHRPDSTTPP